MVSWLVVNNEPEIRRKDRLILLVALSVFGTLLFGYMTLQKLALTDTKHTLEPLLFPYALWAFYFVDQWPILTLLLVLFQFPVYAVLLGTKSIEKMTARIVVLHMIFAVACGILY